MKITPLGDGTYRIDAYTVDVRAWQWNGACSCSIFTGCCLFLLTNQPRPRRQRCPHIEQVREWILEHEYPALVERAEKIVELTEDELGVTDTAGG